MFESESEAIINCLNTRNGSMVLVRDFGLNAVDTQAATTVRRDVAIQLATYYPTISISAIAGTINTDGKVAFNVIIDNKG